MMATPDYLGDAREALKRGAWTDARAAFESSLRDAEMLDVFP